MTAVLLFSEKCGTCVFWPGNLMHLRPGRLADLIAANRHAGTALVCHLTTHGQRPDLGEVLCRGYYDAYGDDTAVIQILRRMCAAEGVEPFEEIAPPVGDGPAPGD